MTPDCSNHPREVAGVSDMKELARMIADLNYETMSDLLEHLAMKISLDALNDRRAGRIKLADQLFLVSGYIQQATFHTVEAYEISKPFMQNNKEK